MKKFLIANPFGIGDVIFTLACVERVRETYPDAFVGFIGNERTQALLELCPAVNHVYAFNRDEWRNTWRRSRLLFFKEIKKWVGQIKKENYDTLLDFSLGREFSLTAAIAGIRERIGLDYKDRGLFLTRKKKIESYEGSPVAQQQLDFLNEAGVLLDRQMPAKISIHVSATAPDINGGRRVLAVAPGGGRSWGKDAVYKQWDAEKFAALCQRMTQIRPDIQIILVGDKAEEALLQEVKKRIHGADVLAFAGEPMEKVCVVLQKSDLLLCNDGGLLHLANALDTKTVSLFGPVDEKAYGPYGGTAARRIVTQPVECRPCYQKFHFPPCPYSRRCLTEISVDKVIETIQEIL